MSQRDCMKYRSQSFTPRELIPMSKEAMHLNQHYHCVILMYVQTALNTYLLQLSSVQTEERPEITQYSH